jgi:hypothetical protein
VEERRKDNIQLALLTQEVSYIKTTVIETKALIEQKYVTKEQFEPVRNIVYGMVAVVLLAVLGGLITLVVRK